MAFERGCTEVADQNLYKCQTVEDGHGGKGPIVEIGQTQQDIEELR